MALIKCKECGNSVSEKAKACPSCGAPVKKPKKHGAFSTSVIILIFAAVAYILLQPSEPDLVGDMSESSICATAGYLIKKNKGKNFRVHSVPCSVKKTGISGVEIKSGYISPFGPTLTYTAIGRVSGNTLYLDKIKVDGIDKDFISFKDF